MDVGIYWFGKGNKVLGKHPNGFRKEGVRYSSQDGLTIIGSGTESSTGCGPFRRQTPRDVLVPTKQKKQNKRNTTKETKETEALAGGFHGALRWSLSEPRMYSLNHEHSKHCATGDFKSAR